MCLCGVKKNNIMKRILFYFFILCYNFTFSQTIKEAKQALAEEKDERTSIYKYDYKLTDIDGKIIDLKKFKGYKIMLVNTASKDVGTTQLGALQQLHKKYGKTLKIIAFPSNDFGKEPAENIVIKKFYQQSYGVNFFIHTKTNCKGENANEIYKYITRKTLNGTNDNSIESNFVKVLISEEGKIEAIHASKKNLNSQDIISWIEGK